MLQAYRTASTMSVLYMHCCSPLERMSKNCWISNVRYFSLIFEYVCIVNRFNEFRTLKLVQNHKRSKTVSIGNLLIPQINFNLKESIIDSITAKKLTSLQIALAPSISYE